MAQATDCPDNSDPLKLVREGTSQDQRMPAALDPAYAPVDGRGPAHDMVFAQHYAALLKYVAADGPHGGQNWQPFFSRDVSAQLALAAVEDLDAYKACLKTWFNYLNSRANLAQSAELKKRLGFLYGSLATLARQLDRFKASLAADIPLQATLQNLIKSQLAPDFKRLVGYYKGGIAPGRNLIDKTAQPAEKDLLVLRQPVASFAAILQAGLSTDWSGGGDWAAYRDAIPAEESVYGERPDSSLPEAERVFIQIDHCATHSLFRSVFDQFLKAYARTIVEAKLALDDSLQNRDGHEPHYALFLAFLRLFGYLRADLNALTARHLDFYYREVLRLKEQAAEPGHAHLLVELAKQVQSREFKAGDLFKAGKDDLGRDAFFANDRDFVANQAKVAELRTLYRHDAEPAGGAGVDEGRLYASPVANSDDGLGAALTSTDQSWHPFFNKIHTDGQLTEIRMPKAEIGFAVASHYLLLAEGARTITLEFSLEQPLPGFAADRGKALACALTTAKGWLALDAAKVQFTSASDARLRLTLTLTGNDPAITPYSSKTHQYNFATRLPLLLVKLCQDDDPRHNAKYIYPDLQAAVVKQLELTVDVKGLRSLAVANDFGPADTSKPFQPFGPSPVQGNALSIGSKELFQKQLASAAVNLTWLAPPAAYSSDGKLMPQIDIEFLRNGVWEASPLGAVDVTANVFPLMQGGGAADLDADEPDFSGNEPYGTASSRGYARLKLTTGFGQDEYQTALLKYLQPKLPTGTPPTLPPPGDPPKPQPVGPTAAAVTVDYSAKTTLVLDSSASNSLAGRKGQFLHLTPFGSAEQHPALNPDKRVLLLPPFGFEHNNAPVASEAEFYIGISGLQPPQNLALLFQVADGTADPRTPKPEPPSSHLHWSYLQGNRWTEFAANAWQDGTDGLLNAGIATFAVPAAADTDHTLMPAGLVWIRAAVSQSSEAVCRLKLVAAQALRASFADRGNSPNFPAQPLAAGTIAKLDPPDAAVKTITQPFPSFGGRGAEQPASFYTRASERLRHKDRAIALWDYERLVLEAFPQIHRVKCLNHVHYEASDQGGTYRELAPGHVTVVTIPDLRVHNLQDPLKPYTSLGLLAQIKAFLLRRTTGFLADSAKAKYLHVENPQFEAVRAAFKLRLHDGFDEAYYTGQLQQAITRYLSPWAYGGGAEPTFNGTISKSALINFIEDQPYVDYVTDFQLFLDIPGQPEGTLDLNEINGSRAVSILVSAPAARHRITPIKPAPAAAAGETCACPS